MAKRRYPEDELLGPAPQPPGILSQIGGMGLSGLSRAANVIDLPGSMVRDTIGGFSTGNWSKYNPLDQLLSPTREINRTTGRDLNRLGGLAGKKDTYGNWWGGLGTEIATDPLTYLTLGGGAILKGIGGGAAKAGARGLSLAKIATQGSKEALKTGSTWGHLPAKAWVGPMEARLTSTPRHIEKYAPEMFETMKLASTGKQPFDLAGQMDQPLGALAKIWPLGDAGMIGTGKTAQHIARGLDTAGDFLRHVKIPYTGIRPLGDLMNLVNKKAGNATDAVQLQDAYHNFYAKEGARYEKQLLSNKWANDLKRLGHKDSDAMQLRDWYEFKTEPQELRPLFDEIRQVVNDIPVKAQELGVPISDITPKIRGAGAGYDYFMRHLTQGLPVNNLGSGGGQAFNPFTPAKEPRLSWTLGMKTGTKGVSELAKDPALEQIMPKVSAGDPIARNVAEMYLKQTYGHVLPEKFITKKQSDWLVKHGYKPSVEEAERLSRGLKVGQQFGKTPQEELTNIQNWLANADPFHKDYNRMMVREQVVQSAINAGHKPKPMMVKAYPSRRKLAPKDTYKAAVKSLAKMSPEARKSGIYGNHMVNDFAMSAVASAEKNRTAENALSHIIDNAVPAGPGTVPVKSLFTGIKKGGLGLVPGDGKTAGALKWLADNGLPDPGNAHVSADTARFLTESVKQFDGGAKQIGPILKLFDDVANFTKIMFTNMDPVRFNVRNRASGFAANVLGQLDSLSFKSSNDAATLMYGGVVNGASEIPAIVQEAQKRGLANVDDASATEILREMLGALEATGSYGVSATTHHGLQNPGGRLQDIFHGMPGGEPFSWGQVGEKLKGGFGKSGTTWNPITSYRGVGQADKTRQALGAAGEDISYFTEGLNRIAPAIALLRDGFSPQEAIKKVLEAQVGYQGRFYTPFEQQVIKRVMLFYSFQKGMIPFALQQLAENPGGRLAQTLRTINAARSEDDLVPQHVAETAAVPAGNLPFMDPLEPGAKRYITGFGMGFEDPAQFVGGLQNAGLEAMSRMNPLLKGPLEQVTGQSFFQRAPGGGGRSLEDLDPVLGRTLANIGQMTGLQSMDDKRPVTYPGSKFIEHVLSNSPISNLLTKARTATDTRKSLPIKAMNLLTGVKATDVSPAAQDAELRNRIHQLEKEMGGRTFSRTYLPEDVAGRLKPKQALAYAQMQELEKLLGARGKARKAKKE